MSHDSGDTPAAPPPNAPATATSEPSPSPAADVVLLGPPTADGQGIHVLRAREERIEAAELRQLREGQPVSGEIVTLKPRPENPRICDVASSYTPPASSASPPSSGASPSSRKGPAQVASQAYREGWDEIFGEAAEREPTSDRRALN